MIAKLLSRFLDGARYAERYSSIVTVLVLLVLIPFAFLWTGQQFLQVSIERAERIEKDAVGALHDAFMILLKHSDDASSLAELVAAREGSPANDIVVRIATVDGQNDILVSEGAPSYDQYRDQLRAALMRIDETLIFTETKDGTRHWIGVRAVGDDAGVARYVILTDTDMGQLDSVFAAKVRAAYMMLGLVVGLILLVLWRQVRMIDYTRMYRDLKAAHDTMSLFINMTAHELRTPLTAIKWSANLITDDPSKSREYATEIQKVSDNLIMMINDLLDLARIQSGKMTFQKVEVDLADVVVRAVTMLRPIASERSLVLATDVSLDRRHTVIGDDARLMQVLTNVVSNALKYTKEGTVTVALEKAKGRYEIRVKDTGMGISAEDQKRLFAPYFRVTSPDMEKTTGTGLGMWITKRMIEEMGGTIDVESIKGVGTHIVMTFKAA